MQTANSAPFRLRLAVALVAAMMATTLLGTASADVNCEISFVNLSGQNQNIWTFNGADGACWIKYASYTAPPSPDSTYDVQKTTTTRVLPLAWVCSTSLSHTPLSLCLCLVRGRRDPLHDHRVRRPRHQELQGEPVGGRRILPSHRRPLRELPRLERGGRLLLRVQPRLRPEAGTEGPRTRLLADDGDSDDDKDKRQQQPQ